MIIMPDNPPIKGAKTRKPAPMRVVKIADGMAEVSSDTEIKYAININTGIDPYIRNGYCHFILYQVSNRKTNQLDLRASLSKNPTKGVSRLLVFKHADKGGSMLNDSHPRYLEPFGLTDLDSFRMVEPILSGDTYHFKFAPHNALAGISTADPIFTVSAPQLSNRRQEVALNQLMTRNMQSDYREYHRRVMLMLDPCERQFGHLFGNQELRHQVNVARDHIYSIKEAYLNGVQEQVVAHWSNLRYLIREDNSRKQARSDKTIYELYMGYGGTNPLELARAFKLMDDRRR